MRKNTLTEDSFQRLLSDKIPILKKLLEHTSDHNREVLCKLIKGLHPSEIAYLIQYLDTPYREEFVLWLKPLFNPEIFLFLAKNLREDIISLLSCHEIIAILDVLESDDGFSLFAALEASKQKAVIESMPCEQKNDFMYRLSYPEHSAGRLMQQEVLVLSEDWSVGKSLEYIAETAYLPENFYEAFVIDNNNCPVGVIPLSSLIRNQKTLILRDIMKTDIKSIPAQWDQREVAFTFRLYDLMSAPVVNESNELVGMITADDVIDIIERKASEDLLHMGHLHVSDFYQSVIKTSFNRIHWLIVTLVNTILTAMVVNQFQETLQEKVILTILMPIAATMGGNTGIQSSTIIIRALATRELSAMNMVRTFFKEVRVALLVGVILAFLLAFIVFIWLQDIPLAIVLGAATIFNMLWAGIAGTIFPVIIFRLKYDPAISAGALISATTDILGYAIFLWLAKCFL